MRHGEPLADDARIVHVDVDPLVPGRLMRCDLALVGDAARAAQALTAALEARGGAGEGWRTPELATVIASRRWRDEPFVPSHAEDQIDPRTFAIALDDLL